MSSRQSRATMIAFGLLGACGAVDPGSAPTGAVVITTVLSGAGNSLYAFEPATGEVRAWASLGGAVYGGALAADSKTLYLSMRTSSVRSDLVAINARTGSALWSQTLATNGQATIVDGIGLITGEAMAASGDNSLLYLWRSVKDSVIGIAALDAQSRRPVAFSGPWNVAAGGVLPMTQNCNSPKAILVVVASRQNRSGGPRVGEAVYSLDARTLTPLDSVLPSALGALPGEDIWQALPGADGRTLYIATSSRIVRYDVCSRMIRSSTLRVGTGMLAVVSAATDTTLVLTDVGAWPDSPGSGMLHLFDRNLSLVDSIDVSTPNGGVPRSPTAIVTGAAVAGADGRTVYVRAGSDEVGPMYPPQPARLIIVDVVSRRLVRSVRLTGFSLGLVFAPQN